MYVWGEMCDQDICYTKPNFLKYNNNKKREKKVVLGQNASHDLFTYYSLGWNVFFVRFTKASDNFDPRLSLWTAHSLSQNNTSAIERYIYIYI